MKYEDLVKTVPQNEIETVKMNDGSLIQCKKIPIATIDSMDSFLTGVKDGLNLANGSLSFIATCGKTQLYSPVGDVSTYMKNKDGNTLSASLNKKHRIESQPGFRKTGLAEQGVKTATNIAKVIPWMALTVTVIEVGIKIVINQERIRAEQNDRYDKLYEKGEEDISNLWQAMEDYTTYKGDEAFRVANINRINLAQDNSRNNYNKLLKDASKSKKINERLVFAMKSALDAYSFSELLKLMYTNVDRITEIAEKSLKNIEEKTIRYKDILEKCYSQHVESRNRLNKGLEMTQFNNASKSKKHIAIRAVLDLASGGITEVGSLASKGIGKIAKPRKDKTIAILEEYKNASNPFVECIKNADDLLMLKKLVMRDDKYLYYQI